MGATRADLIRVVEACYDVEASEHDWLQGITAGFHAVLQPEEGLLAYHVDMVEGGFRVREPVQYGPSSMDMVARIRAMGELMERGRRGELGLLDRAKCRLYERVMRHGFNESADKLFHTEHRRVGPDWMYTLGAPIDDTFALINHHVDGNGVTGIFGGMKPKRVLAPAQRAMYQMLGAHIKSGFRLRRRLGPSAGNVDAPADGAILDADARVVHAEGDARDKEATERLTEAARRVDRARTQKLGRGPEALEIWQGLIDGRWSLVESFDVDGRRYMLAHRNPADVGDPRGLTTMESRVVALVVRGYSDKLTAYHLGLAQGTVSSHLSVAIRKLGVKSRVELVRRLGRFYPQPAP